MPSGSLHERNKQRTFERIKQVAKQLFEQKGYEETTTRELAEAAEVGTGTLFLYVKDKAELLLLVYTDALEEIIANVFATLTEDMSLQDALLHIFSAFFHFYKLNPGNARAFLKELLFQADRERDHQHFAEQNEKFVERLADLVRHAQERGEIRRDVNPRLAASSFFALYFATITAWLGSYLILDAASLEQLRVLFDLQIKGMLPE